MSNNMYIIIQVLHNYFFEIKNSTYYLQMNMNENSQEFFDKYLNGSVEYENANQHNVSHRSQLQKEEIQLRVNRINMKLQGILNQRLGDIMLSDSKEAQKTLRVIEGLMGHVHQFQQIKVKMNTEIRQLQNTNFNNTSIIDKLTNEKKNIENDRNNANQMIKQTQRKCKQAIDKLNHQKDDLTKQIRQIQIREKNIQAEFRKKQNTIKQYQQQIKRFQQEKPNYKNNFQVMQKFENGNGLLSFNTNAENQYGQLANQSIQFSHRKLVNQNQYLKECLNNIYKELNSVLELKKQMLKNRRGYDQYQDLFDVHAMKPQALTLPDSLSKQRLKELNQNISKFKEAMKIGDLTDNTLEDRKESCVGGIKHIIKNYKQIVQSQDQLLNKVILKSKDFKAAQMAQIQNRYARMNQANELDKAKKFVEEQSQYLQAKNVELEKTRKMMQNAMKKAQQNKRQMLRQRQNFESQALQIRRSIQVIPTMIQQELSKGYR